MHSESLLLCLQEPATGPYPEKDEIQNITATTISVTNTTRVNLFNGYSSFPIRLL